MGQHVVGLKAGEIYVHITQCQENVKPIALAWLICFKGCNGVRNIKFSGEVGSKDEGVSRKKKNLNTS